jgi:AraC-like DNA-binding protein
MKERPADPLSLDEAARLAGRSRSTVSHLFRRALGRSFKRSQIETRLERADELFHADPHITVREVAYRVGYDDPLYFSRIYKKHRGVPPSEMCASRPRRTDT